MPGPCMRLGTLSQFYMCVCKTTRLNKSVGAVAFAPLRLLHPALERPEWRGIRLVALVELCVNVVLGTHFWAYGLPTLMRICLNFSRLGGGLV